MGTAGTRRSRTAADAADQPDADDGHHSGAPADLLAVANSQSMDGDLSGAILTGSGSLAPAYSILNASSSPVNFTIPVGFTPPVNTGNGVTAPYTVAGRPLLGRQLREPSQCRESAASPRY